MIHITRIYTTRHGQVGVCYTINGQRAATFAPRHCASSRQTMAHWLERSLGLPVAPAHARLNALSLEGLAEIARHTYPNSQAKMLRLSRRDVQALRFDERGHLEAEVASQTSEQTYTVTLAPRFGQARCTCKFRGRSSSEVCKHAGALARLLLAHPAVSPASRAHPLARAVRGDVTRDPSLTVGWVWLEELRPHSVKLTGREGSCWVDFERVVLGDVHAHHGRTGVWIGYLPTDERLDAIAPWPQVARGAEAA